MAGYVRKPAARSDMPVNIRTHCIDDGIHRDRRSAVLIKTGIHIAQQFRVVISCATEHHRIDGLQMLRGLVQCCDAAVDPHENTAQTLLEAVNAIIVERWYFPVLLGDSP